MITLNTDQGLVRIATWEEVETTPGYIARLDLSTTKANLKSILGSYAFNDLNSCGLASCRTGHKKGYLVQTDRGWITNIGHQCGKKYFSVDFERMAKAFDRDLRAQEQRERLISLQQQGPSIRAQVETLKEGPAGANWISRTLRTLRDSSQGLPTTILALLNGLVRRRDGTLTLTRLATAEELALRRAKGERIGPGPHYAEDRVGYVDGISALFQENDLRTLLIRRVLPCIEALEGCDVEALSKKRRHDLVKAADDIEPALTQAAEVVHQARRLLTKDNIAKFAQVAQSKADRHQVLAFAATLPTA